MAERDAGHDRDRDPLDEDAAWAELVAAYGEQPDPEKGRWPATGGEDETPPAAAPAAETPTTEAPKPPERPGSFIVYAPGSAPATGPRPHPRTRTTRTTRATSSPPEPPPLPSGDVTSRFAWLAVLGGPLLLLVMVLLQQELTWWITTLGIGGFLGGSRRWSCGCGTGTTRTTIRGVARSCEGVYPGPALSPFLPGRGPRTRTALRAVARHRAPRGGAGLRSAQRPRAPPLHPTGGCATCAPGRG
ncbi:hypothetical protein GCM10020221_27760 [Streptomyces thioluteus]|uniref:Uncharacterized protein n=1 Tax=Streptomyces thioluteus TaxID=66431 RepID=A0ABN3X010_STRTU